MSDNERELMLVVRLHDDILRERAEGLRDSAEASRTRLAEREASLARLRTQVAALKASLAPKAVPAKEGVLDSARFTAPSLPRPAVAAPAAPKPTSWTRFAPYAAIAVAALAFDLAGARRPVAAQARDMSAFARPAVAPVVLREKPAAKGVPVVADEDRSQEAMLLVHEWRLPGDEQTLGERLGGALDLPGGRPAWSVERTAESSYRVTFRAGERDVPLAFEADLASRVVWPTAETQDLLAPRFAALRDSPGDR